MVELWGIRNCQNVRKAIVFLDSRHVDYRFIDYKKNPPSLDLLRKWVELKGIDKVINKRGTTYRALEISKRGLSDEEIIEIMHQNPTLIKRPILVQDQILEFGFCKEVYETYY